MLPESGFTLTWKGFPGRAYVVERSETLDGGFVAIGREIEASAAAVPMSFHDQNPPPNKGFYRVTVWKLLD